MFLLTAENAERRKNQGNQKQPVKEMRLGSRKFLGKVIRSYKVDIHI